MTGSISQSQRRVHKTLSIICKSLHLVLVGSPAHRELTPICGVDVISIKDKALPSSG